MLRAGFIFPIQNKGNKPGKGKVISWGTSIVRDLELILIGPVFPQNLKDEADKREFNRSILRDEE